jgi:cleavage and polyadenylation specificity factor subunit 2
VGFFGSRFSGGKRAGNKKRRKIRGMGGETHEGHSRSSESMVVREVSRKSQVDGTCMAVEIGEKKLLVNMGTLPDMGMSIYGNVEELLAGVTHILLCSSEISSLGGIPFLSKLENETPILGTVPIKILGRIEVLERNKSLKEFEGKDVYTEKEIDEAFDRIVPLKYMQSCDLGGDVSVVPLVSGNSVGGCLWKIVWKNEEHFIMDKINHRREMHLDGIELSSLKGANVFVNSRIVRTGKTTRKERDSRLVSLVSEVIASRGVVFIPITYSRFLEVVLVLDEYLKEPEKTAFMSLFSFYGKKYLDSAKTILEWMGTVLINKFNQTKENPFVLPTLRFESDLKNGIPPGCKVVFSIDPSGLSGFSNTLLQIVSTNCNTTILSVLRPLSLARGSRVRVEEVAYETLGESEVAEIERQERERKERARAEEAIRELIRKKKEDSSEEEENEIISKFWHEVQDEIFVSPGDGAEEGVEVTFPNPARKTRTDDYGDTFPHLVEKEEEEVREEMRETKKIEVPCRITRRGEVEILLECDVGYIDFRGESDLSSVKTILESTGVKSVVVHGEDPSDRKILSTYLQLTGCVQSVQELVGPLEICRRNDWVVVKLTDALLSSMSMQAIGDGLIGHFNARISREESKTVLDKVEGERVVEDHVCLGRAKLSEMRKRFAEESLRAEIVNGQLVVNEKIMVRTESGTVIIEGESSREFYQVKKIVSRDLALVPLQKVGFRPPI